MVICAISFHFSGISTLISKFRDKVSVLDYSVAGLITGTLFKISLGPKGMISGGFFGTLLGTFAGALTVTALKLTGVTMNDVHDSAQFYFRKKDELFHGGAKVKQLIQLS